MKPLFDRFSLDYFRCLARIQLKKFVPDVIGIIDSSRKTLTQDLATAVLSEKYHLKASDRATSESDILLDILGISPHDDSRFDWLRMIVMAPVQLMITWRPYEKYIVGPDYLPTFIQPRTWILLDSRNKEARLDQLPATGLVIVNADNPAVMGQAKHLKAQLMTFGIQPNCDVRVDYVRQLHEGTQCRFSGNHEKVVLILPPHLPDHFEASIAAAFCVCLDEGSTLHDGGRLIQKYFIDQSTP